MSDLWERLRDDPAAQRATKPHCNAKGLGEVVDSTHTNDISQGQGEIGGMDGQARATFNFLKFSLTLA